MLQCIHTLSKAIGRDNFSIGAVTEAPLDVDDALLEEPETFDVKDTMEADADGRSPE